MLSVKAGDYLWMVEFRFGVPYPETIRKMVVTHTDSDTNRFECIPTSGTANRLYEFDANGVEYREDASVGYEQCLLIFENKDTIYDICDAVRCKKRCIWQHKMTLTISLSKPLTLPLRFSA